MRAKHPVTEVPDVVGFGAEDACAMVRRAGLVPIGPEETGAPASGVVTSQRPVGNAGAESGSQVVLWTHGGRHTGDAVPVGPMQDADDLRPV